LVNGDKRVMDVATLKAKIKSKQLPKYLIFSGPEWKVQDIYIQQIAKVTGKEVKYIDSVTDIFSQLKNRSFVKKSVIYKVRDDKELLTNEKLQQNIESVLADNMLIHTLTSVDKRTKYYKTYKDTIVDFEQLTDANLKKYIKKEINLSDRNCQILIEICEHDYGRILLEIDKIKRYAQAYPEEFDDVGFDTYFKRLVEDGTIYEPPYDAIFDLVDAILDRKVNESFDLLQQSYDVGEATMVMLSVLYNNTKAVLQVQTYEGDSITKGTGLTGWQVKNASKHKGRYSDKTLIYIVRLVQKIESGIKTGKMEDEYAMQYLLTHIFSRR